jgi:hypothetical protein
MRYVVDDHRYDSTAYRRCGRRGLELPLVSFGRWQNFGPDLPFCSRRPPVSLRAPLDLNFLVHRCLDLGTSFKQRLTSFKQRLQGARS